MPSDEPSRPYNWRPKSLAKLENRKLRIVVNINSISFCDFYYLINNKLSIKDHKNNVGIMFNVL